jgi:predicted small lipoprotein YifL
MVPPASGDLMIVTSRRIRMPHLFALAGALGVAFTLAGCGVKGPLEPPPSAAAPAQPVAQAPASTGEAAPPPSASHLLGQTTTSGSSSGPASSAVSQASAANRSSVLDWLIK